MRTVAFLLAVLSFAVVAFALPSSSLAGSGGGCSGTAGSDVHRAGLVVSFGGQQPTQRFCVEFTEESISGIELLQRSGLSLVTQIEGGLGAGVCAIDGIGSDDPTNCFKYSTTPPYRYWVYFRWTGADSNGAWQFSNVGASTREIHDGDIDGWSWGNGANAPPESPDGVLDLPTPTPLPPTLTPTPVQATNTPRPTATRATTITPVPADTAAPNATLSPATPEVVATPTVSSGSDGIPPPPSPADAEVAGAQATPRPALTVTGASSVASVTLTPAATPTAPSGVIVVDPTQARDNAATAERADGDSGSGGSSALIGFALVAAVITGGAGVILYRRRSGDA